MAQLGGDRSRATARGALRTIAKVVSAGRRDEATFPWERLRYQHTAAIRSFLASRYSPPVANQYLSMLRSVLGHAWRLGQLTAEDYYRAVDLRPVPGKPAPAGRMLKVKELARLFRYCRADTSVPRGRRNACALALMYGCGLRRSELIGINLEDFDLAANTVRIRGKGRRDRIAYLPDGTKRALMRYLEIRGGSDGALLWPLDGTRRRLIPRRLHPSQLERACRTQARAAHLRTFSPHDLRRSFVSQLLANGADLSVVAHLAGHANVQTTARYDHRGEDAAAAAAALLTVPFD